ncbi:hypothetical protein PG997_005668 [Apiospora hydei]|uniref:Ankyrin n=1 Tax=Apiospora hydei TaxID=1337664 RepID=A0ABR1WN07_9PEZI
MASSESARLENLALIAEAEDGAMPMTLSSRLSRPSGSSTYHKDLARSPSLAEACGCGPLSRAILAKDAHLVQLLLGRFPASIEEVDSFGLTPLHFAASLNLLPCLPSLLSAAKAADIIQREDGNGQTALYTALIMARKYCRTADSASECTQCSCCDSLMMLLEAGALVCFSDLEMVSWAKPRLSLRAWRHFIGQLKDQREYLKTLALRSTWAVEDYLGILHSDQVIDLHASAVYKRLRSHGIEVPADSVAIDYTKSYNFTIFNYIPHRNLTLCDLAFQLGFQDVDFDVEYGLPPLCLGLDFQAPYINWLIERGADLKRQIWFSGNEAQASGLLSAHYLLCNIGSHDLQVRGTCIWTTPSYRSDLRSILNRALSLSVAPDHCWCACSTDGCTPFLYMLKAWASRQNQIRRPEEFADLLFLGFLYELSAENWRLFYLAALRFLGFVILGLTHTCCDAQDIVYYRHFYQTKDRDEVEEIQQEESGLIKVLDDMVGEFEDMTADISGDSEHFQAFWEDYWTNRVPEIVQELEDSQMTEAERQDAEMIGVVWESGNDESSEDPEDTTGNPYHYRDIDYWYYELDSIAGNI